MDESTQDLPSAIALEVAIDLFSFYPYGYRGRIMYAVRAPFAMSEAGEGLVGRVVQLEGKLYRVLSIRRQVAGSMAIGETIGVEVSPLAQASDRLSGSR
jgi:hypothetical protein